MLSGLPLFNGICCVCAARTRRTAEPNRLGPFPRSTRIVLFQSRRGIGRAFPFQSPGRRCIAHCPVGRNGDICFFLLASSVNREYTQMQKSRRKLGSSESNAWLTGFPEKYVVARRLCNNQVSHPRSAVLTESSSPSVQVLRTWLTCATTT